jgi:hypothetical protein
MATREVSRTNTPEDEHHGPAPATDLPPTVIVPAARLPRLGDFEGKPVVYAYSPRSEDVAYGAMYYGLVEAEYWPYGAVRTQSGKWYAYFRNINGATSPAFGLLAQNDGPLRFHPASMEAYVGALDRTTLDGVDVTTAPGPAASTFSLRVGSDSVEWVEGSHLQLSGPIAGPGLQMWSAWREPPGGVAHLLHAHLGFEVHGHVLGEPVAGYLGLARAFLPYATPFIASGRRFGPATGLCEMWMAFLNVYADGSSERGMMASGGTGNRFRFATVVLRDGLEFSTDQIDVRYRLSRTHYFESIEFHIGNGQHWTFTAGPHDYLDLTGMGPDFSIDPPTGYHVTLGSVRRHGDHRTPLIQVAWVEGFPEAWPAENQGEVPHLWVT